MLLGAGALAFLTTAGQAQVAPNASPRVRTSLDADWRFTKNDPADTGTKLAYASIKNWMMANGEDLVKSADAPKHARPSGNIGDDVPYTRPDFNDSQWRQLTLPHDWGIEGPFEPNANGGTGKLPFYGIGWYRKHFDVPASDQGKQMYLDIDGAMSYSSVWLNGQYAGGWGYGFSSYRVDLTPFIKPGGDNVLSIRLENPNNSSRWYPGGGIYRNVWLVKTAPVHVGQWGTYLTTPKVSADSASVELKVTVDNNGKSDASVSVRTQFFPIDINDKRTGAAVASTDAVALQVPAGKSAATNSITATIARPALWSPKSPNRYVAVTTVEQNGQILDSYETTFGVRSLKFDGTKGLIINDEPTKIKGVCDHADLGALGTIASTRGLQRQIEILQGMGCNAIRTSHNPPAPELLELADKMGMVIMDEMFDCWSRQKTANDYHLLFPDWSEKDARMLLHRDRNHPSVIMWSIGNEIGEADSPQGQATAKRLGDICHEEDPGRAVTSARNGYGSGFNGYQNLMDAFGYNYLRDRADNYQMYVAFHAANPNKMVFSSESASTISTRGVYAFPAPDQFNNKGGGGTPDGQMSSYDLYAPSWASPPDWEWKAEDMSGIAAGEFVWTGFDYLGEPTRNGGGGGRGRGAGGGGGGAPGARSSYFGIIDLAGFPKDRYYLYESRWKPETPMAHILPHWNWSERVGIADPTPVHVYTSGDSGELFLNGKSLGKKTKGEYEYRLRWDDVKYEPGELKVVTYKAGKEWATETIKTTGAAAKVMLKPDRATITADGQDLSFVTVSIADNAGLMVPRSMNDLKFSISGPGEIVAVDNGDPNSLVPFQSHEMKAFNGLCLVIVRAKPGQTGQITLTAQADGLQDGQTPITGIAK
jgi:beta-galactosidase